MTFFSLTLTLLLIMDPVGIIPVLQGLLSPYSPKERKKIILRECGLALLIMSLFFLAGNHILSFLELEPVTLKISGGILLFLVALGMLFPSLSVTAPSSKQKKTDLFLVPIAVPLMSGPSCLSVILLHATEAQTWAAKGSIIGSIFIACFTSCIILLASEYFIKHLGERSTLAMERLMGMILILISIQMFLNGIKEYTA